MAFSTWLAATLPDGGSRAHRDRGEVEGDDLRLAVTPGIPMHDVFGSRGASAPNSRALGQIALSRRSSPSRSEVSRALSASAAASAAAPKPTMPSTFSLPARRPRS